MSCQIVVLPSTGFELTPLIHCSTIKINRDRILYSAFTTDQDLAQENSKCWFSTLNKIFKILKLDIKDLADNSVFRNNLIEYYHQQSDSQLQKIKSGAVDSKLILFSNIFIPNFVPFYLGTNLSKSIKSKTTQLRISAHCLNIERVDIINLKFQEKNDSANSVLK